MRERGTTLDTRHSWHADCSLSRLGDLFSVCAFRNFRALDSHGVSLQQALIELLVRFHPARVGPFAAHRGAHVFQRRHYSGSALALAEMAYRRGFSVAILSSAYNWEFMERASTAAMPGHTPVDARDTHVALDAVYRDLAAQFPGCITKRVLMGYSMGAFHAFFIAAAEQNAGNKLITFDRYITLDAPVQLNSS